TGLHQTPEMIVTSAIQEDVDCLGMSILSGAHMTLFTEVLELLRERGAEEIIVFGGGIIPEEDAEELKGKGVRQLFPPGTTTEEIVSWIRSHVEPKS
ncbi:cobalamin-dependent protein, partial [bacterium]|nr:cobalamin-dependent protein [bacterium]